MTTTNPLLQQAAERASHYLEGIATRSVAPSPEALAQLAQLDEPLPERGVEASALLERLDRLVSPATMAMTGPRFFGFVIGGVLPATLASNWLTSTWDQNAALHVPTPGVAVVERVALGWLLDVLQLPREAAGAFVTGATVANMTALAAARHRVLERAGWPVESQGLFGAPAIQVVVGEDAHATLFKALGVLGLGRDRVVRVPADDQGRMRADALPRIDGPAIVCVQAGNVNSGACDPIDVICSAVQPRGAWVHVDGAFGLWANASPQHRALLRGVERADSWATDAHKWLNVPYDSGVALVRDEAALRAAMSVTAAYLPTEGGLRNPSDFTPELSRRARGVDVYVALAHLGRAGIADLVDRSCTHARRFAGALAAAGFEILNDVVLNQVLVSFGSPERTKAVVAAIQEDGTCWCGITQWRARTAMRISVSSWATTAQDVERSIEAMIRVAASCRVP